MKMWIILFAATPMMCLGLDIDIFSNTIVAVKEHFRSGCVHLLQFDGIDEKLFDYVIWMKSLFKHEVSLGIMRTSMKLKSLEELRCVHNTRLIVVPRSEEYVKNYLFQFSRNVYLSEAIWLIFLNSDTILDEFFNDVEIPYDCQFLVAQPRDNYIILTELYRVATNFSLQSNHYGYWTPEEGLTWPELTYYQRRSNLFGMTMKIGVTQEFYSERMALFRRMPTEPDLYADIWSILERELNFTTEYFLPDGEDLSIGDTLPNGSWTGLMGMLQRKEAEMCNAPLSMTAKRMQAIDFTVPLLDIKTYLVIKKPSTYELKWNIFLMPFTQKLWAVILLVMLCLAVSYKAIGFLEIYFGIYHGQQISILGAFLTMVSAFCQQGNIDVPKASSLRLVFATSYLTAYVILACYSAAFITHLTLRKPHLPFQNFEEFLEDGTYRLGMLQKSAQMDYFRQANVKLLKEIYQKMIEPYESTLYTSDKKGMEDVCRIDKFAYMVSTYSMMKRGFLPSCNLAVIPQAFYPGNIAIGITKKSPYLGIFNFKLNSMKQDTRYASMYKQYNFKLPRSEEDGSMAVNLYDAAPIMITLATGSVLALIVLVVEKVFNYVKYHS